MTILVTDYGADYWLGQMFGLSPTPARYYVALLTDDGDQGFDGDILASIEPPTLDDQGVATGYARKPILTGALYWAATEGGFTSNLTPVDFGIPVSDWGVVTGWALCTAPTSGQVYNCGDFANPQLVAAGNQLVVPAGGLTVTLSSSTSTIVT